MLWPPTFLTTDLSSLSFSSLSGLVFIMLSTGFTVFTWQSRRRRPHPDIPKVIYHPSTISVTAKTEEETVQQSFQEFVQNSCPSLRRRYTPSWWLKSGHLQTLYCALGDFTKFDPVQYKRTHLRLIDGGTLGLDFVVNDHEEDHTPETPCIVVLHGLTGGSHESYVRSILATAGRPVEAGGLGYRAVVVNFRGCAGVPITSAMFYSAGHTDDLRSALMYIQTVHPHAPLLGIGFSLGANILCRYLGEEGKNSRLSSGCILGCPWDLELNDLRLRQSFMGKHVYSTGMGRNLQQMIRLNKDGLTADSAHPMATVVPKVLALKNPTLDLVDFTFTSKVGAPYAPFPFPTAQDYYRWGSSHHFLPKIGVPCLAINAVDDPVVRDVPIASGNGWAVMVLTRFGGHLGWWSNKRNRWIAKPVLEWMQATGVGMVHPERAARRILEVEGWLREEGNDVLGCKVVEMTSKIASSLNHHERFVNKLKDDKMPTAGF